MRILVVDQCSKAKNAPDESPSFDADQLDAATRAELLAAESVPALAARDLYAGRQQRYVSEAVDRLRTAGDDVTRVFISAGFGVIDEATHLPPYDVTFHEYTEAEIDHRAATLGIREDIRDLLDTDPPYDVVFFPLGRDYYRSLELETLLDDVPDETTVVVFNREASASAHANVVSLPARTEQAKELGTIVVALKGQYLKHFADHRANGVTPTTQPEIVDACRQAFTTQAGLGDFE